MVFEILRHTPMWVWGLLALLIWLGLTQWRDREVTTARIVATPLAFGVLGVSMLWPALRVMPISAALWLVCVALAFNVAARWLVPKGAGWNGSTQRLFVRGSGWPMLLILATFLVKYAIGVFQVIQPATASSPSFLVGLAVLSGVLSGLWLGRAWATLRLTGLRQSSAPHNAQPCP